tara:strand:+ start:998 stop:1687 length:690 start_codon:yes stop_codon:yes gene_type:complete
MILSLRYKITIQVLIISCGVVCSSFAQSVYDFKTKRNNVKDREIEQGLSSEWKGDYSYSENKNRSYSRSSINSIKPKIRLRFLSGSYSSDNKDATSLTSNIIWDRFGFGQSDFKSTGNRSGDTYEVENKFLDLSYTFGNEYTLTLGGRSLTRGEITITDTENIVFKSTKVYGSGYFSNFGIEFGFFEILLGYEYFRYVFIDFETESESAYWGHFEDFGGHYNIGIGIVF